MGTDWEIEEGGGDAVDGYDDGKRAGGKATLENELELESAAEGIQRDDPVVYPIDRHRDLRSGSGVGQVFG